MIEAYSILVVDPLQRHAGRVGAQHLLTQLVHSKPLRYQYAGNTRNCTGIRRCQLTIFLTVQPRHLRFTSTFRLRYCR